jgi:hypothetical protein
MPKYYHPVKLAEPVFKKLVKARGKLDYKTSETHSLEKTVEIALDLLLSQQ